MTNRTAKTSAKRPIPAAKAALAVKVAEALLDYEYAKNDKATSAPTQMEYEEEARREYRRLLSLYKAACKKR